MGQGIATTIKYKVIIGVRYVRLLLVNGITDSYVKLFMKNLQTYGYKWDYKLKKHIRVLDKTWYYHSKLDREFRVPITQLKPLIFFLLRKYKSSEIAIEKAKRYHVYKCVITFNENIIPYGYQEYYIDYLYREKYPNKLVQIQMGKGKTVIASKAIAKLGMRTCIIIQPKYIDKWIDDITSLLGLGKGELYVVKGSDSLRKIIAMAKEDIDSIGKVLIISNKTIQFYIKYYEEHKDNLYGIVPDNLMRLLRVGVVLTDEVHEHFHATYKMLLHFNQPYFIGLTATLSNRDSKLNRLYEVVFPIEHRSKELDTDGYINTYSIVYLFNNIEVIKHEGIMGYNHNTFERSILKIKSIRENYLKMILNYVKEGYLDYRESGDKAIIYCSSIAMCTIVANYIEKRVDLVVKRYVGEDDYTHIKEGDIIVSTIQSGGTGLDIKGLISVFLTVSIDSLQANKQVPGRLRYIEGKDLRYYFFYTPQIKKHSEYAIRRKQTVLPLSRHFYHGEYRERL